MPSTPFNLHCSHHHVAGFDALGGDARAIDILFRFETHARRDDLNVVAADLGDDSFRGKVAMQNYQLASLL